MLKTPDLDVNSFSFDVAEEIKKNRNDHNSHSFVYLNGREAGLYLELVFETGFYFSFTCVNTNSVLPPCLHVFLMTSVKCFHSSNSTSTKVMLLSVSTL